MSNNFNRIGVAARRCGHIGVAAKRDHFDDTMMDV